MKIRKLMSIITAAASTAAMAGYTTMTAFAEEAQAASDSASAQQAAAPGMGSTLLMLAAMFAILYFVAIRPQKKRDRELKEMQVRG